MKEEELNSEVCDRICKHMNEDHQDAINQYALHYGKITEFKNVIMKTLNSEYLELETDKELIQINFDHTLKDSEDAHKTLIHMLKTISKQC
ncbi:DUF2470 domain-containing protein [Prochlorococcus sp. MIT 1223]|uniref:DUF2470 domain-containing protein n=1 Tax=Prochlorococcus sp. MIT 1223 TaxID=3096217 RepID=UPI002A755A58|nr:DUF2470 domain-containing protein [Prochlorococcus sp. MIT 1223]